MELDNAIATPLYKQLEKLILDKITNGTLTPDRKWTKRTIPCQPCYCKKSLCRTGQSRIPGEKIRKRNIYRRKENAAFPLRQIKEGMDDIATGNTRLFSEAMADIRSHRSR